MYVLEKICKQVNIPHPNGKAGITKWCRESPISSFSQAWDICSAFITAIHQCIHAAGIEQCSARLTQDPVTVKLKTFPSDFNKPLCREKPQMNQLGLRSLLDDDASSQKVTVRSKGGFTTDNRVWKNKVWFQS